MLFVVKTIVQWRRFIVFAGLATAAAMAGVSFLLPTWYTATSSVFPPETKSLLPSYADLMQSLQLPILGPNATGLRPNTIYIDILQSRRVGEKILEEFDLKREYDLEMTSKALDELGSHTFFTLLENGLLRISYEDRDPRRAAAVTNRYIELLDEFNQEINVTRASKTKEFISSQIDIHARELRDAEEALKRFQEENQALELDEQVRSSIELVSTLTADAIALEVELEILRQYASQSSQEYVRKKKEYDEILNQLKKFKIRSARDEDDFVRSFFPTFDKLPEVGLDMARLVRRVKVEEKVYELLIKEYEMARIEEARDTPTVQVLDKATVPELRSRPKRKVLVLVGGVLGLGWSSLLAIFIAVWREDSERRRVLADVFEPLAGDLGRFFRRGK